MRTEMDILSIKMELQGVPLFERGDKRYSFTSEGVLEATEVDMFRVVDLDYTLYLLRKQFEEKEKSLLIEALEELQEGDTISTLVMKVYDKQKQKWKPVREKCFSSKEQLYMINKVFVEREGHSYGFNYRGEFACIGKSSYEGKEAKVNEELMADVFNFFTTTSAQFKLVRQIIAKLEIGDTIKTLNDKVVQERKRRRDKYKEEHPDDSFERFITKIDKPVFERATDNLQKETFDFIRVDVSIVTTWHEDRMKYIQKNQHEITKRVIERIQDSKRFQAMGVPINFWKISSITLTRDSILEYLFELKIK